MSKRRRLLDLYCGAGLAADGYYAAGFDEIVGIDINPQPNYPYTLPGDSIPKGGRTARDVEHGREVMGVTRDVKWDELKEGFPPAYSEHIGRQLLAALERAA